MSTVLSKVKGFSKKKKALLIVSTVLFVLFTIAGGYLLWRVSQPETIAPEDSEAYMYYDSVSCNEAGCLWRYDLNICTGKGKCRASESGNCRDCYLSEFCHDGWLCCEECPTPPPPDPCAGDDVNDKAFAKLTTYNIKNNGFPSKIGPFPKGAKVVLYYKSLLGSGVRPKVTFTYGGKDYSVKMPVLDSNKRAKVQITSFTISKDNDYIYLKDSRDDNKQGDHICDPGDEKYISFGWMDVGADNKCGTTLSGPPTQYIPFEPVSVASDIKWAEDDGATIVSKQCWADWREWKGDYDFDDYFLQIGYIPESPAPKCGTRARKYGVTETGWKEGETFCDSGTRNETPNFPDPGASATWKCISGTKDVDCTATRDKDPAPKCGTNARDDYLPTDTKWPSGGTFCAVGTADPTSPVFPQKEGAQVTWKCKSGTETVNCSAEKLKNPVCGDNAQLYAATVGTWPDSTNPGFCKEGDPTTSPTFPNPGENKKWKCITSKGTIKIEIECEAARMFPDPVCGTFVSREFEATDEDWPSQAADAFCKVGTPSPMPPAFPLPGSSTTWICLNLNEGGESPSCTVSRLPYPVCGTNESEYQALDTDWLEDGTFCEIGEVNPSSPSFPSAGSNTTWRCKVGSTNIACSASRLNPDPACGTYGGAVYQSTVIKWPSGGTFCSVGTPEPSTPVFPDIGSSTVWTCNNGGEDVSCLASRRQEEQEEPVIVLPPAEPLVIPPRATLVVPPVPEKIPETGIFDDIERPVLIGGILVFLGITWSWIGRGMYITINFLGEVYRKTVLSIKDMKESIRLRKRSTLMKKDVERKKKFERKVSRKI